MNEFVWFEWEEMGKVYIYMGGGGLGKERKRSGKDNKKNIGEQVSKCGAKFLS